MALRPLTGLVVLLAIAAGCGSENEAPAPGSDVPGGADPAEVAVIDEWVSRLREGDVEGAAELFAIPSVAENGPTAVEIDEVADARLFNASLPCGAVLVRAEADGEFTVATFRLTERPGPGACGSGTGLLARTAFVIEDGLITEWRRAIEGGAQPPRTAA